MISGFLCKFFLGVCSFLLDIENAQIIMNRIRQGCPESLNSQTPFFFYQMKMGEPKNHCEKDKGVFVYKTK